MTEPSACEQLSPDELKVKLHSCRYYAGKDVADPIQGHVAALQARVEEVEQHLGNLLAIIHRDGGHYISENGWEKAINDAHEIWARHMEALEKLAGPMSKEMNIYTVQSIARAALAGKGKVGGA